MANFDTLSKRRIELNNEITELNSKLSTLKKDLGEIDHEILLYLGEQGQDLARANGYTFSIKKQELYSVPSERWGEFYEFVEENKCAHVLQRRLTQQAIEELVTLHGDEVPVEIFEKTTLNTRKAS